MADFTFTTALARLGVDIDLASDDIRMLIVMASTSAAAQEDTTFLSGFTTLDEYNGSGYARQALTTKSMAADNTNNRGKFTSDAATFTALGVGSRAGFAIIIYKHVGADSANIPIFYKVPSGFPFTGNGQDVVINPHADGWAYSQNG